MNRPQLLFWPFAMKKFDAHGLNILSHHVLFKYVQIEL